MTKRMTKFHAEFGNTRIVQNIALRLSVKQQMDNRPMDLIQLYNRRMISQISSVSGLRVGAWSQNWEGVWVQGCTNITGDIACNFCSEIKQEETHQLPQRYRASYSHKTHVDKNYTHAAGIHSCS